MNWAPAAWNDIGAVGLAVMFCAFLIVAYTRSWVVPIRHHREIIDARDRQIDALNGRAKEDAETIRIQAATIAEKNASEDATARILAALREAIGNR